MGISAAVAVLIDAHQIRGSASQITGKDVRRGPVGIELMKVGCGAGKRDDVAVVADRDIYPALVLAGEMLAASVVISC